MGPIALLAMLSGLLMTSLMSSDDDTSEEPPQPEPEIPDEPETPVEQIESETPVEPIVPETPVEPEIAEPELIGDIGATFTASGTNVEIEVGEDETRSLAVIYYEDTEDASEFFEVVEARFYLVPEDTDWSTASWETENDIPGVDSFDGNQYNYQLADFEAENGLEFLGAVDLRNLEPVAGVLNGDTQVLGNGNLYEAAPEALNVTANAPVAGYFLTATTDGDELISFLPEDFIITRNGNPQLTVTEDTNGTDTSDWLFADADGITLNGGSGSDFLETDNNGVTLNGNTGNDAIMSLGANATVNGGRGDDNINIVSGSVDGGNGDDTIDIADTGRANGGAGNDTINNYTDGVTLLYGDEDDDNIGVWGAGSEGYGGTGDDFIAVENGATGYGNDGSDSLQLDSGTTGYGGDGDDLFTIWNQFRNDEGPAVIFGGEGADTIDARVWNASRGESGDLYLRMADFDPSEDVLQVGTFQSANEVADVEINEAADGSYTDVRVTYTSLDDLGRGIAIIRLDGVTGMTADQVIITS